MGIIVVKYISNSSMFLLGITVVSITMLVLGYFIMNKSNSKRRRYMDVALLAQRNNVNATRDTDPRVLKQRIIQILTNNTPDMNSLSGVMDHVVSKINADMQPNGLLNGLVVERQIGAINGRVFMSKLSEYIKNLANSLSIPLMDFGGSRASFTGRQFVNNVRGRLRSTVFGPTMALAAPAATIGDVRKGRRRRRRLTSDSAIESIDSILRRR